MTAIGLKLLVWEEEAVECEERDDGERWKWWNQIKTVRFEEGLM